MKRFGRGVKPLWKRISGVVLYTDSFTEALDITDDKDASTTGAWNILVRSIARALRIIYWVQLT
jgi:hypothetical protein